MSPIKEFFEKNDHYAKLSGIKLLDVSPGFARASMEIKEIHLNSLKTVHGGAIFTLADFVFAVAANTHEVSVTSINCNISYVKSAKSGALFAEAKELSVRSKIVSYAITVKDDAGEIIALFQGLGYKLSPKK